MNVSEHDWMAYVDGELDDAGAARMESAMRADPELAALVATQQRLRARVEHAFAPTLAEAIPARLFASLAHVPSRAPRVPPAWFAAAASLALGVLLATWWQGRVAPDLQVAGGKLVARSTLAVALDQHLAADGAAGPVAVGLSFRSQAGGYCRSFSLAEDAVAGLACRDADDWRIVALGEAAPQGGEFRQAASVLPPGVLAEVEARLDGEALDAAGERQARDTGWHCRGVHGPTTLERGR